MTDSEVPLPETSSTSASADDAPWLSIAYLFTFNGTTFHSRAIALLPLKIDRATMVLTLFDTKTQKQFASTTDTQQHGLFMTCSLRGELPGPDTDGVSALLTLYLFRPGNPIPTTYTARRKWAPKGDAGGEAHDITQSNIVGACQIAPAYATTPPGSCVQAAPGGSPIRICLEAGAGCDYVASSPDLFGPPVIGGLVFSEAVAVPLSGSALLVLDPENDNPNLSYLYPLAEGYFTADGNTLSWNIPASSLPASAADTGTYEYTFVLQTVLSSGQTVVATFASSNVDPSSGSFNVPSLLRS